MADYTLSQGTLSNPGTASSDNFYVPVTRTGTAAFLSGTYTVDSALNSAGNDTLVFRATNLFTPGTYLFLPQFELVGTTPAWIAYDQRSASPLRIEWPSMGMGDKVAFEIWNTTPTSPSTPVLIARQESTASYITTSGTVSTMGTTQALHAVQTQTTFTPYMDSLFWDNDVKWAGIFYVSGDGYLGNSEASAANRTFALLGNQNATTGNTSDLGSGLSNYIYNQVRGFESSFTGNNGQFQGVAMEIHVDSGALNSGRRYLELVGSTGTNTLTTNQNDPRNTYNDKVPDVEYALYIDSSASNGITVHETDTGTRNWWDSVRYSDIGITSNGNSGQVNTGSASNFGGQGSMGMTLNTGLFTDTGAETARASISSIDTTASNGTWLNVTLTGGSFAIGDKVYLYGMSASNFGYLQNSNTFVVSDVGAGKIKLATLDSPTSSLTFDSGMAGFQAATLQKISDYTLTVNRSNATDVFAGFEDVNLSTGNDTINYNHTAGNNGLGVQAGKGDDTWNLAVQDDWGYLEIESVSAPASIAGITNGISVNLSGVNRNVKTATNTNQTLDSQWSSTQMDGSQLFVGSMLDEYGSVDRFNISSGGNYTDSQTLAFSGTDLTDRYYFAVDGLGTIGEYRIRGNAGYDQVFLTNDATYATARYFSFQTIDLNPARVGGNPPSIAVEGYSRFNHTANYVLTVETTTTAQGSTQLAKLTQVGNITGSTTDSLTVSNANDWSVGDVVTFRTAGTTANPTLINGTEYRISEVTGSTIKLQQIGGTSITNITSGAYLTGATIERLVDTGVVDKNYITFGDAPGDFSRLAFRYDAQLLDSTQVKFRVESNEVAPQVSLGEDYGSTELSNNEMLSSLVVSYRDLYDNSDPFTTTAPTGVQYINGTVDKGKLGFDRLVDYQNTDVVGQRHFAMTDYNDTIIQTLGSSSLELKLSAGNGEDKIFIDGRSGDANQRIEINLAQNEWGNGQDGQLDIVEIGIGNLNKNYKSVQYIDVTSADMSDVIRFVDAAGYTVELEQNRQTTPGSSSSYKNYVTYNVYEGSAASNTNLVMTVRVGTGDRWTFDNWNSAASDPFMTTVGSTTPLGTAWGLVTSDVRSISANPTPASMTANNDASLLFEDTSVRPYLMGAGDDYVVTMGGDQDIGLGAGDDFISVRNTGQQLFVSGGAGNDSMGLAGFYNVIDGNFVSDQWSFSSMDVSKARTALAAKYPDLSTTTDQFEWSATALDRVMVATNRLDGTTIFFQTEQLSFSNGTVSAENFLPAINETYDLTVGNQTSAITLYGRSTNDTVNLKVDNVDNALKYVGTWLDSLSSSLISTGTTLLGTHTLAIKAQTATSDKWFSQFFTNAGINLVDIENIRLFDSAGRDLSIRVAGSSSYNSVADAVANAQRGDVIFVAETVQGALTGSTRAAVAMDTTVSIASGLRVAFEEGANRTVNATAQLTVNMTNEVKSSSVVNFMGNASHALEVLGTANVNVNGSSYNDIIIGNKGNNVINGLAGNDLIFGGNGSDMLIGSIGDDTLIGGSSHRVAAMANFAGESWLPFNTTTDTLSSDDPLAMDFRTGDKVVYTATGGSGISALIGNVTTTFTSTTALYVIRIDGPTPGSATYKLASSQANALNGVALDIISNGSATSHAFTLDNTAYTAANLAGNDYLYGGSGNDHLIATGVMGSLTTAGVRDTLTINGGSGADKVTVLSNTGLINVFGGSGADKIEVMDVFMDAVGVNKSARIVDFSATQDDVQSYFTTPSLGSTSIETRLNAGGVTLSQLVAPPLPIVDGSGENGNYQAISDQVNSTYALPDYGLSVADLLNIHNAHAA